eukprot:9311112-Pyramimonas_sp.AAC.1
MPGGLASPKCAAEADVSDGGRSPMLTSSFRASSADAPKRRELAMFDSTLVAPQPRGRCRGGEDGEWWYNVRDPRMCTSACAEKEGRIKWQW